MRKLRIAAWAAVVLVIVATIGLYAVQTLRGPLSGSEGVAAIGGPFTLVNQEGETVTQEDYLGKPTIYFFGFTHCPDVCPTTLYELSARLGKLGPDAERLNAVFVTVDPERDRPEDMKSYVEAFDADIDGLTGSPEQVQEMLRAYRVFAAKAPSQDGEGYNMDHTASLYLMDAEGGFVGTISPQESEEMAMQKLQRLVRG